MLQLAGLIDYKIIYNIFKTATDNLNQQGIFQWDDIYPSAEIIYDDIIKHQMYVLKFDQEIAAVVVLNNELNHEYKTADWKFENATAAVIRRLCVNVEYQNKGIGRKTVLLAEDLLRNNGYKSIRLDAFLQNPYSVSLYQKLGYINGGNINLRKGIFVLFEKAL